MTLSELLSDLQSKPEILHVGALKSPETQPNGYKNYAVDVLRIVDTNIVRVFEQKIAVLDEGTAQEAAYYSERLTFSRVQARDQFYPNQTIINQLETQFPTFNVIDIRVAVDREMDIVTVRAEDTVNDEIITRQIGIWMDNGSPRFKWIKERTTV